MTDDLRPSGGAPRSRVVAGVGIITGEIVTDASGAEQVVRRTYTRGETATLSPSEESRLDALGMLAPAGWTAEDVQEDVVRRSNEWARSLAGGQLEGIGIGPAPPPDQSGAMEVES
jgi:hypothetical protein